MSEPVVEVRQGKVKGAVAKNIDGGEYLEFRRIPYAEPPIGNLRFKDPTPLKPWSGVRDVGKFFAKSVQYHISTGLQSGSEDCLYLTVATNSLEGKRPVMVWLHGGAFNSGSPSDEFYGPDYLLKHDIVFVGITYRLGCFGFLNLNLPDASGNQALKDQVAALRWVQDNIGAFGGDPGNVTIFGHSAGGACAHLITLSPLAKGLYHKVIVQSGVAINPWAIDAEPVKTGLRLAEEAKKRTNDPAEALEYLMTLSTTELIEAQERMDDPDVSILMTNSLPGRVTHTERKIEDGAIIDERLSQPNMDVFEVIMSFTPSIDAKSNEPFMPKSPLEMIMKHGIDVPIIAGFVSEEGIITMLGPKGPRFRDINRDFASLLARHLRMRDVDRAAKVADTVRNYYFGEFLASASQHRKEYAQLKGDMAFANGIHQLIDVQSKKSTPTYMYRFSYRPSYRTFCKMYIFDDEGTCHCDDLNAIFNANLLMGGAKHQEGTTDRLVMERMTRMWTDFAKTGNPTPKLDELIPCKWEPVTKDRRNYLEISDELTPGVNPNEASWKMWKSVFETLQWSVGT